jgi:hypothetical protein
MQVTETNPWASQVTRITDLTPGYLFKVISDGEVYIRCSAIGELRLRIEDQVLAVTLANGTAILFPGNKEVIPYTGTANIRRQQ